MSNKKNYTTPFWGMVFIMLVEAGLTLFTLLALRRSMHTDNIFEKERFVQIMRNNLIWGGTILVILLGETITYWIIRRRIDRKDWVWGHLGGLLLAFLVLPLLFLIYTAFLAANFNSQEYQSRVNAVMAIRTGIFWTAVTIAHGCFAMVIRRALKKRATPESETADGPDILNDYA